MSEWEEVHRSREWGTYPCEHLVRFMARQFGDVEDKHAVKVLDLGCGAGGNAWYLAREGFNVWAVDSSPTAVHRTREYLEEAHVDSNCTNVDECDATNLRMSPGYFDCVVDICCLQHVGDLGAAVREVHRVLSPGGLLFSVLASLEHSLSLCPGLVTTMHRLMQTEVLGLFQNFERTSVDHAEWSSNGALAAHWLVVARK